MDTTKIYFFHNVYGDAQELIDTAPSNVVVVPFGWDEETEIKRNTILSELNTTVPSLPCIIKYGIQTIYDLSSNPINLEPQWYAIPFNHNNKPWSWEQMNLVETIKEDTTFMD